VGVSTAALEYRTRIVTSSTQIGNLVSTPTGVLDVLIHQPEEFSEDQTATAVHGNEHLCEERFPRPTWG